MLTASPPAGIRPRSPSTTLSRAFSSDMLCRSPTTSPLPGSPTQPRYQDTSFSPGEEAYSSMPSFSWQLPPVHPSTSAAGKLNLQPLGAGSSCKRLPDWTRIQILQQCRLCTAHMQLCKGGCTSLPTPSHDDVRDCCTTSRAHSVMDVAGSSSVPMITASSAPLAFYPAASGSLHPSIQPVVSLQHLNGHSHAEHGMLSNASSASTRER